MSDREVILQALLEIQRRFRLNRTLHESAVLLGMAAVGVLLWRLLHLVGGGAPAASALLVLAALLLWALGAACLLRSRLLCRISLGAAAAAADQRAGLKDELQSALWFLEQGHRRSAPAAATLWIDAQVARAAASAQHLDPAALLPVRLDRRALMGGVAALVLLVAAWTMPPLVLSADAVASGTAAAPDAQARQAQVLRDVLAEVSDARTADKIEHALRELERKGASEEEKRRALAAAEQALQQADLQAASTREGLFQVAGKLQGNRALQDVAEALKQGDARKAADLLQQMAPGHPGASTPQPATSPDARDGERELEHLLQTAGKNAESEQGQEVSSVAAREAIDRLKQIAEQLDSQTRVARAAQALEQLQLTVAQRSQMSAGRFGQEAAQNSTASPDTGQTSMPGGRMFRSAAVAQESRTSAQQEGSKSGNALGEAEAEAVFGAKATPLAVRLKQEGVAGEHQDETGQEGRNWFYAESKQQHSLLELQGVQEQSDFARADTVAGEGISMRHRRIVKDYFINLREGAK